MIFHGLLISLSFTACATPKPPVVSGSVSGRILLRDSAKLASLALQNANSQIGNASFVAGELIVRYKNSSDQLRPLAVGENNPSVLQVQPGQEQNQIAHLVGNSNIEAVGLNYRYKKLAMPNDVAPEQYNLGLIGMPAAWDIERGKDVLVAVVDDGYDPGISDLKPRIALPTPPNGFKLDTGNNDNDPTAQPGSHGAAVASVIAANTNNGFGMAGIAWEGVRVVPIKIFSDAGDASTSSIADGINTAVAVGAKVINLSLCLIGSDNKCMATTDPIIEATIKNAYEHGVIVVAAAGNDNNKLIGYPASSRYAMSVGSVDQDKTRSIWKNSAGTIVGGSNYGPGLDIVAPGTKIPVLITEHKIPSDASSPVVEKLALENGTSFSSPTVAAVAALIVSKGIESPDVIYSRLLANTEDLGQAGRDDQTGNGLLRADLALRNQSSFDPNASYPLFISFIRGGQTIQKISSTFAKGRNVGAYNLSGLDYGDYIVRAQIDVNRNEREDTGDYVGQANMTLGSNSLYGQDIVLDPLP